MKSFLLAILAAGSVAFFPSTASAQPAVNVTQHHNNPSRDGLFIDPAFTLAASANVTRITSFDGTIVGNVYAQPLYIEGGPSGPVVIAVTESNNVYALNATTGAIVWQRNVGTAIASGLPCGNISPIGITGTPIVDLASRSLFFDAETTPSSGVFKHLIFSLNVDTGAINSGWPIDVNAAVSGFDSSVQSQRAAPGIVNGILYMPYGGRFGDCGSYRGRLLGIPINNPASVSSFATTSTRAGIWGPGGVASDGVTPFVTTGNGSGSVWGGSEAVIRLQPGPTFSGNTADYWAPLNWMTLDSGDTDLGGSGPIIVDVPGATPSALVLAIGKDRNAYLLNRANLGGVAAPLASATVSSGTIIGAAATYRTGAGTWVALRPVSGTLTAFKITATSPPTIATGWSISSSGRTAPFVTSTDGSSNAIVWAAGSDGRLRGYNGDTGAAVYAGGGANELMSGIRSYNTGIAARGRIYYAADNKVYAFQVPLPALSVSSAVSRKTHAAAGPFDIPLPLTGTPGVECRSGGATNDYSIVLSFSNDMAAASASVTSGAGTISGTPVASGKSVTVNLTGVTSEQTLTLNVTGTDVFAQTTPATAVSLSVLLGDTNGDGTVNSGDALQTRNRSGQSADATNFRSDVNTDGTINAGDSTFVRGKSGTSLPQGGKAAGPLRVPKSK